MPSSFAARVWFPPHFSSASRITRFSAASRSSFRLGLVSAPGAPGASAALAGRTSTAADTSYLVDRRCVAGATRTLDVEVWRDRRELEQVIDTSKLKSLAREGDDRDRRLLQRQLAALGGNDDLLELLGAHGSHEPRPDTHSAH
jgi:hypothetical protein